MSDPQREFDGHLAEIYWTNLARDEITAAVKHEAFQAGVRQVWRDNRHDERHRLPDSARIDDSAFLKFTAQEIAAVLAGDA